MIKEAVMNNMKNTNYTLVLLSNYCKNILPSRLQINQVDTDLTFLLIVYINLQADKLVF